MGVIIGISRYILPFLAIVILTKCILTLLLGHPQDKTYGYIMDMVDGERYNLNMWETSIGRSNSCDIVIGYDTVSRFQAVISRRIDGWYIYDLLSKSGIEVNGEKCQKNATIVNGDIITMGSMKYRFEIIDDPVQRVGKKRNKKNQQVVNTKQTPKNPNMPYGNQQQPQPKYYPYGANGNVGNFPNNAPNINNQQPNPTANYQPTPNTPPMNTQDFYSEQNKPQIHFEKSNINGYYQNDNINGDDIYSNADNVITPDSQGSFTVDTPENPEPFIKKTKNLYQPSIENYDTGEVFVLCGNHVSIGRGRGNDIKLTSPACSRRHALLILYEDGWAIEDAGSTAGTFLNSTRVTEPQLLFDGDIIALGDERLRFTANHKTFA